MVDVFTWAEPVAWQMEGTEQAPRSYVRVCPDSGLCSASWLLEHRGLWWMLAGWENRWHLPTASQQSRRPRQAPGLGKCNDSSGEEVQCTCGEGRGAHKKRSNIVFSPQEVICNHFSSTMWGSSEGFSSHLHEHHPHLSLGRLFWFPQWKSLRSEYSCLFELCIYRELD